MAEISLDSISALRRTGDDRFVSVNKPFWMANSSKTMAYGGCAMVLAINAAAQTVDDRFKNIYSVLGSFLGPTMTDKPVELHVQSLRETRTFSTRFVVASQDGRACLSATVDYIIDSSPEAAKVVPDFSSEAPRVTHPSALLPERESITRRVEEGRLSAGLAKAFFSTFSPILQLVPASRAAPEGMFAQTLNSLDSKAATTQDGLKLSDRRSYLWYTAPPSMTTGARGDVLYAPTQATATAMLYCFLLDGASGFTALGHSKQPLQAASAASSLDFAYRIHGPPLEAAKWYLKELGAEVAASERTYVEAKLWEEGTGRLAATLTEATVLRAAKPRAPKL